MSRKLSRREIAESERIRRDKFESEVIYRLERLERSVREMEERESRCKK